MKHFMECKECSSKPGSPTLCESCINNRHTIGDLENKLKEVIAAIECGTKEIDYRGTVYTQTFGISFLNHLKD